MPQAGRGRNVTARIQRKRIAAALSMTVLLLAAPAAVAATANLQGTPARAGALIVNGALELAARMIDASQPADSADPAWVEWEIKRLELYQRRDQAVAARHRIEQLPSSLPLERQLVLRSLAAEVELRAGNPATARAQLRGLLWRYAGDPEQRAAWRRRIIHAYLAEDRLADARVALRYYNLEYRPDDTAWSVLYARVQLLAGEPAEAMRQLAALQSPAARVMLLLARLRTGVWTPQEVISQALSLVERPAGAALARDGWLVIAEAAVAVNDRVRHTGALERVQLLHREGLPRPLVPYHLAGLLEAYRELAEDTANRRKLFAGDDPAWLDAAIALSESGEEVRARAMLAVLAAGAADTAIRITAHHRLLESWSALALPGLFRFVHDLYYGADGIGVAADVPASVRFTLAQQALAAGRPAIAEGFLHGLEMPPEVEKPLEWRLRRARLTIYTGRFAVGAELVLAVIREWGRGAPGTDVSEADAPEAEAEASEAGAEASEARESERLVQAVEAIVFDLQAIREHELALALLNELLPRINALELKRRLLYWAADSEFSLERHQRAADLYLQSALLGAGGGFDVLGKPARIKAAAALTEAGLYEDARRLYEALLGAAATVRERTVVRGHLENLRLFELQRDE